MVSVEIDWLLVALEQRVAVRQGMLLETNVVAEDSRANSSVVVVWFNDVPIFIPQIFVWWLLRRQWFPT